MKTAFKTAFFSLLAGGLLAALGPRPASAQTWEWARDLPTTTGTAMRLPSTAQSAATDAAGNVYLAGSSFSRLVADTSINQGGFVAVYSPTGTGPPPTC